MKSDGIIRQGIAAFIVALAVYIIAFHAIEDRRTRNGPWQVAFTNDPTGAAALLINQPKLAITNVLIVFPGATVSPATNAAPAFNWAQARPTPFDLPSGRCIFQDATSLPGTLVFAMFGHEIQLLPRVLTIDNVEQPWCPNAQVILKPAQSSATP